MGIAYPQKKPPKGSPSIMVNPSRCWETNLWQWDSAKTRCIRPNRWMKDRQSGCVKQSESSVRNARSLLPPKRRIRQMVPHPAPRLLIRLPDQRQPRCVTATAMRRPVIRPTPPQRRVIHRARTAGGHPPAPLILRHPAELQARPYKRQRQRQPAPQRERSLLPPQDGAPFLEGAWAKMVKHDGSV